MTGNPAAVARSIWSRVNIVLALDPSGAAAFSQLPGLSQGMFEIPPISTDADEAIIWLRNGGAPFKIKQLGSGKDRIRNSPSSTATMPQRGS